MLSFQLRKQLRNFTVDITHQIDKETLVLIGHSGCGKSTTLKMLSGLLAPDEGFIHLNGRVLYDTQNKINLAPEHRNIGYVFQNYALFPHLTVTENVAYGISRLDREEKMARVNETLDFLGIQSLSQAKPAMLSGGEQQRVALARALVTRPQLLLLDEPLSALDISTRSFVRTELKEILRKLSIPTIIVTHDYEDARVLADRIAVMDHGEILQSGTDREISEYPASSFVAEFTGTNLLPVPARATTNHPDSAKETHAAFHPWSVAVSFQPTASGYEWQGKISDITRFGGYARLHIEGSEPFFADIQADQLNSRGYQPGDTVHVTVHPDHVRLVTPSLSSFSRSNGNGDAQTANAKIAPKGRKRLIASLLGLVAAVVFVAGFGLFSAKSGNSSHQIHMVAFVAANATDPFNETIVAFKNQHPGLQLEATYAGTQVLRTQLENGAKADLFLSADQDHIQAVQNEGLIDRYDPVSRGHEVIVVPRSNPAGIHSLQDLATKPSKLIIGTDSVPIGKYTRQVFEKASQQDLGPQFPKEVMSHVVSMESNVKQVLQKVALGEADAGIVYRTDVTPNFADKLDIIEIPPRYNVAATNYIAVMKNTPNPELANELKKFMLSEEGQKLFQKYGYDNLK
ncbi:molybdate ABC transporter substrate-binding protein [Effusibacillus dendaii]|uniref:Carnitine transport ATP-binding protein OpuCA n=1 Tax=Effusibacillus dendaii TaxID=2743772 RepID=A0A7I8DJV1_9BACL|nr:molybdate ABC transporter substrate-binding protein [Effusibacillus dendaii]BCJ88151.1 hypothetical protein skT53_31360 [Effusibacillus dendaii]